LRPDPIDIKVSAQLPNVSSISDFMVINATPYDTLDKQIGGIVINDQFKSNAPSSISEIVQVKPFIALVSGIVKTLKHFNQS